MPALFFLILLWAQPAFAAGPEARLAIQQIVHASPVPGVPAGIELTVDDPEADSAAVLIQLDQESPIWSKMEVVSRRLQPKFVLNFPSPRSRATYRYVVMSGSRKIVSDQFVIDSPCEITADAAAGVTAEIKSLSIEAAVYRAASTYARAVLERGFSRGDEESKPSDPPVSLDPRAVPRNAPNFTCEPPWNPGTGGTAERRRLQGERDEYKRALINILPAAALDYISRLERSAGIVNGDSSKLSTDLSAEELASRLGRLLLVLNRD